MTSANSQQGWAPSRPEAAPPSWLITGERCNSRYQQVAKSRETARNVGYSEVMTDTAGHSEIFSDLV